jgi:hypothetical protein
MNEKFCPTYVPFLDKLLGGGTAPSGVYGILGPTGIGKTHLASMIATNGATCGSVFEDTCQQSFHWILFDIETQRSQAVKRIFSHAARVKRGNVWAGHAAIQAYEQERRADLPKKQGRLISEVKRLARTDKVLVRQLTAICNDDLYEEHSDGVALKFKNIVDWIDQRVNEISSDSRLGGIVFDGVGNIWNHSLKTSLMTEREFIHDFVDNFCRELSSTKQCPVWITHQVNGTACVASPLAPLTHRDAARCKTFAHSLDACFVLGKPAQNGIFAIQCTKSLSGSARLDRLTLTHDKDFATIVEVDDYVEDRYHQTWKQCPKSNTLLDQVDLIELDKMLKRVR